MPVPVPLYTLMKIITHVKLTGKSWEPITGPVSPDIKGCNSPTDIIVRETLILGKGICEALSKIFEIKEL